MEKISVIVPIYGVEAYLDRCVRSIVDQTYENTEIILVDDGSPDNCPAMCDAWAERDSRIKVVHKKNGGLSDARNAGFAVATGELISFIDSDDYIEPEFLSALYRGLKEQKAEVAECGVVYVAEDGRILRHRPIAPVAEMGKMEALSRLVREDGVYDTVWNRLYRREMVEGLPFAVGKLNEDAFWTYHVLDRVEKLAVVDKPLYNYLQRGSSIIGVGYNLRRLDGLEALMGRMEYLQKYEALADVTRQLALMNCLWHYQTAMRLLSGSERSWALEVVDGFRRKAAARPLGPCRIRRMHYIWTMMFRTAPGFTARIRNLLKIGL